MLHVGNCVVNKLRKKGVRERMREKAEAKVKQQVTAE